MDNALAATKVGEEGKPEEGCTKEDLRACKVSGILMESVWGDLRKGEREEEEEGSGLADMHGRRWVVHACMGDNFRPDVPRPSRVGTCE